MKVVLISTDLLLSIIVILATNLIYAVLFNILFYTFFLFVMNKVNFAKYALIFSGIFAIKNIIVVLLFYSKDICLFI